MSDHSLPALLAGGPRATVNSDDPAYFGGYLNANFIATPDLLPQLGVGKVCRLLRNGFEASFAPTEATAGWIARLDAAFAAAT